MLAILAPLELVEDGILGEGPKTLGTDEAMLMPAFATYRGLRTGQWANGWTLMVV